jgi:hypothetical protein
VVYKSEQKYLFDFGDFSILLTLKYWSYWPDFYVNETLSAIVANADFVRLSPPSDRMIVQLKNIKNEYGLSTLVPANEMSSEMKRSTLSSHR